MEGWGDTISSTIMTHTHKKEGKEKRKGGEKKNDKLNVQQLPNLLF